MPVQEVVQVAPGRLVVLSEARVMALDLDQETVAELYQAEVLPDFEEVELLQLAATPDGGISANVHHLKQSPSGRLYTESALLVSPEGVAWESAILERVHRVETSHSLLDTSYAQIGNPTLTDVVRHTPSGSEKLGQVRGNPSYLAITEAGHLLFSGGPGTLFSPQGEKLSEFTLGRGLYPATRDRGRKSTTSLLVRDSKDLYLLDPLTGDTTLLTLSLGTRRARLS